MGSDRMALFGTIWHLLSPSLGARREGAKGKEEIGKVESRNLENHHAWPLLAAFGRIWPLLSPVLGARRDGVGCRLEAGGKSQVAGGGWHGRPRTTKPPDWSSEAGSEPGYQFWQETYRTGS